MQPGMKTWQINKQNVHFIYRCLFLIEKCLRTSALGKFCSFSFSLFEPKSATKQIFVRLDLFLVCREEMICRQISILFGRYVLNDESRRKTTGNTFDPRFQAENRRTPRKLFRTMNCFPLWCDVCSKSVLGRPTPKCWQKTWPWPIIEVRFRTEQNRGKKTREIICFHDSIRRSLQSRVEPTRHVCQRY